ncbi:hypothetical protein ACHHYP_11647 [Achlya hypogyna]|uniref:Uncharacterized protein n=1 Tax=Achlya hypogyna TaxID=1202772 RepID=A0A1V9YIL4_ACHHY|nr:hypothetical protein ACHHYP_11647 [Achlya hypogyna]
MLALLGLLTHRPHPTTLALISEQMDRLPVVPMKYLWTGLLIAHIHNALQDKDLPASTIERCLEVLSKTFARCDIQATQTTQGQFVPILQTLLLFLPQLDGFEAGYTNVLTDEGRLLVLQCINALCNHATPLPFLAARALVGLSMHSASVLLLVAQKDPVRACRIAALETLTRYARVLDDVDAMTMLLPGVAGSLCKLVHFADYKWGSRLPATAIRCLETVLSLTLRDSRCASLVAKPEYTLEAALRPRVDPQPAAPPTPAPDGLPRVDRSPGWLREAQSNLTPALTMLCSSQRHHSKPRVRAAVVALCHTLVTECRWSLAPAFFVAFETLLSASEDPLPAVHGPAQTALAAVRAGLSPDEALWLRDQAPARLAQHLAALAKRCAVDVEREAEACATLRLVAAYCAWTDVALDGVLPDVLLALQTVLRVDAVDAHVLVHERSTQRDGRGVDVAYFRKRFVHFRSDAAAQLATRLVRVLGVHAPPLVCVDVVLDRLQLPGAPATDLLLMLNHLLLGAARLDGSGSALPTHVVAYVLERLLELPQWAAAVDDSTSLLLEVVGSCAQALGTAFAPLLLHVLYPVVEHLAGHSAVVHQAAAATLHRLACHGGYDDVPELLRGNMDYVVDLLGARLQQLDAYPHTPSVVEGLLAHAGDAPLPLLHDAVRSVVASVDKHIASCHSAGLLRVMLVVVATAPRLPTLPLPPPAPTKADAFVREMRALFDPTAGGPDYAASEAQLDAMLQDADADDPAALEAKTKAAMPVECEPAEDGEDVARQGLTQEIVLRCAYFAAAPDVATSCLACRVLAEALPRLPLAALRPLVARVWPAVAARLDSPRPPVVLAALQVVLVLAQLCGDFVADSFVADAWPRLVGLLQANAPALSRADLVVDAPTAVPSPHSLGHQLQATALRCLATMCAASPVLERVQLDVARAAAAFLRATASPPLQEAARDLFLALAGLNDDALFPLLASLAGLALPAPPSPNFPKYTPDAVRNVAQPVVGSSAAYSANALWLLRELRTEA